MKKLVRRVNKLAVMFFMLVAFVTGCGGKEDNSVPTNVALVIGHHANAPQPDLNVTVPYIMDACNSYGYVGIVTCDGAPFQLGQADIPVIEKKISVSKREEIAFGQAQEIVDLAGECVSVTAEVDTLKAIEMGARTLKTQNKGNSYLVILDSGLSTTGELNFVNSFLENIDSIEVVKKLKENSSLPDLTNVQVVWYGLGDTLAPQKELSAKNRETLQGIWEAVLLESGASTVVFETDLPTSFEIVEGLPEVSVVEVLETKSVIEEYNPEDVFVLNEEMLKFKPGSAEILTPESEVRNMLEPIAEYLLKNPEYKILLAGTTASAGTEEELKLLSEKRGECVKQILLDSGAKENQITVLGLGYGNSFSVVDTDENGNLIGEKAALNRTVRVLDYESKLGQDLLKGN